MVPDRLRCVSELCFIHVPAVLSLFLSLSHFYTHTHTPTLVLLSLLVPL